MAMRAATMGSLHTPAYTKESDSFMRKLTILLLLVVSASLGIVIWFRANMDLPLLLSTFFADACIGLVAGYGSRLVFRKWNLFVHYLIALLLTIAGMILMGTLTKSVLGIGPLAFGRDAVKQVSRLSFDNTLPDQLRALKIDPRTAIDFSKMAASDAAHLAVSLLLAVLSLQAWRGSVRQAVDVEPLGHSQVEVEPRASGVSLGPAESFEPRAHQPVTWFRSPAPSAPPSPRPRIRTKNRSRTEVRKAAKATSARKSRARRGAKIQLAVVEEHRCPYCLDPVTRADSRGVKECDVCHTLHHADCWAITGFCQVPHLNS